MLAIKMYALFSMLAVIAYDVTTYKIPNWLVGSLLALYPIAVFMMPGVFDWPMAIAGMLAVFAVGYFIFSMKWMGAGDIKFITVCSLWVGFEHLLDFIFLFAILGGVLSVLLWVGRKILAPVSVKLKIKSLPRILREGEPAPYGVAISVAFLMLTSEGKIPGLAF